MVIEIIGLLLLFIASYVILDKFKSRNRPPGPLRLPIIGNLHLLHPIPHQALQKLSLRYGPMMSFKLGSHPALHVCTPKLAKEFLKTHEASFSARHAFHSVQYISNNSSFAFSPFGSFVKGMRKFSIFKLLGTQTITKLEPLRTLELKHFLRVIHEKSKLGEPVNLTTELIKLTNNIIAQMMWSIRPTDMQGLEEEAWTIVRDTNRVFAEMSIANLVPIFKYIDFGFVRRYKRVHKLFHGMVDKIIADREEVRRKKKEGKNIKGDEGVKDFLEMLLDLLEDEKSDIKLTKNELKGVVLDFFTAGTDSAVVAVEWALVELMRQPEFLKKAQQEIEDLVGKDKLVEESDCPNLPFVQAIVKETFRLHPPIPLLLRKAVEPCEVNGYKIDVGTLLFVNVWAMGRDPDNWENPMEFKPDRFLKSNTVEGDSNNVDVKGQHFQYLPFGTGRRVCVAIPLAMQEVYTTLATMIQCFDYKAVDVNGNKLKVLDMTEKRGITAPRADDLLCVPSPRMTQYDFLDV
jgi:cytochrome P450